MCGRAKLEGDISQIKIVFRVPPDNPTRLAKRNCDNLRRADQWLPAAAETIARRFVMVSAAPTFHTA